MGRSSQQTMAMEGQAGPRISIARFLAFTQNQGRLLLKLLKNIRMSQARHKKMEYEGPFLHFLHTMQEYEFLKEETKVGCVVLPSHVLNL